MRADLVVTSGGVSEGDHDVVKESLSRARHDLVPRRRACSPASRRASAVGEDDTPIFTLPGNPVSAYVSFEVFVLPAIRRMMGKLPYVRPATRARVTHGSPRPWASASTSAASTSPTAAAPSRPSAAPARTCSAPSRTPTPSSSSGEVNAVPAGDMVAVRMLDRAF